MNKLISVTSLLLGSGRGPPAGQFEELDDDVDELLGELLAAVHESRGDCLLYARLLEGDGTLSETQSATRVFQAVLSYVALVWSEAIIIAIGMILNR